MALDLMETTNISYCVCEVKVLGIYPHKLGFVARVS
jgi:hypothetical protein